VELSAEVALEVSAAHTEVALEDMPVQVALEDTAVQVAVARRGSLVVLDLARIAPLAVWDVEAEVAVVRSPTSERGREVTRRRPLINT